jgi:CheY-like chemotaxis protein
MRKEVKIIIAEDDKGHAALIRKNLRKAGITNQIVHFRDGQETLDYLFKRGEKENRKNNVSLLLLLDIKMPKIDGIEVLCQMKADPELRKVPVIVITTRDDPREVERCHSLGCSHYITKPIDYKKFMDAIQKLGLFLLVVEVPLIGGVESDD